jgi:hypothetical protein
MATLKAKAANAGFPVGGPGDAFNLKVATGTYEVAANPAQNDVIEFCKLPAGAVVVMGWLYGDDIDTGTETFDMDIGWSDDTDGFGNFGVITGDAVTELKPEVSIFMPFGGVLRSAGPKKFTSETKIQGLVNAAANAGGTGTLTVVVLYYIDPNFTV